MSGDDYIVATVSSQFLETMVRGVWKKELMRVAGASVEESYLLVSHSKREGCFQGEKVFPGSFIELLGRPGVHNSFFFFLGFLNVCPLRREMTFLSVLPVMEYTLFLASQCIVWFGKGPYTNESPQLHIASKEASAKALKQASRAGKLAWISESSSIFIVLFIKVALL